jgi:hypothetical protein
MPLCLIRWALASALANAGAIYSGRDVVQDGNIITSGVCPYIKQMRGWPDGTAELTQKLIAELKKRKNQ